MSYRVDKAVYTVPFSFKNLNNGIFLSELFRSTVRKNHPSFREKVLKFEAEG